MSPFFHRVKKRSIIDKRGRKLTAKKPFVHGYYVSVVKPERSYETSGRALLLSYKFTLFAWFGTLLLCLLNWVAVVFMTFVPLAFFYEFGRR